jgi:midasin (ATPase involved in ribosome maturation)
VLSFRVVRINLNEHTQKCGLAGSELPVAGAPSGRSACRDLDEYKHIKKLIE